MKKSSFLGVQNRYYGSNTDTYQLPEEKGALRLAKQLIDQHKAACVHIGSQLTSIYHWKGKTETATEVPVVIKTLSAHYAAVEQTIKALHPYELPEIIAVPIIKGLPAYLQWIADETVH